MSLFGKKPAPQPRVKAVRHEPTVSPGTAAQGASSSSSKRNACYDYLEAAMSGAGMVSVK